MTAIQPEAQATLGYAGDVSPQAAWDALAADRAAQLVDCRTDAEWAYVGKTDLGTLGKAPVTISWQIFPKMQVNEGFVAAVDAAGLDRAQPLYLLCRSGVRSVAAAKALTAAGFTKCFNILGGFEGDLDADKHRGRRAGWKQAGLPWVQS